MSSYFLRNALRLHFLEHNSFKEVFATPLGPIIEEEMKESSFSNVTDFMYNVIGYIDDNNYSPYERAKKRKEINQNLDDPYYWGSQISNLKSTRTSEAVDYLDQLNVLGLGKEYTSVNSCDYGSKEFIEFLSKYKEQVSVFCEGADIIISPLEANGQKLTYGEVAELIDETKFDKFCKKIRKMGISENLIIFQKDSKLCSLSSKGFRVPSTLLKEYSLEDLNLFFFYAYVVRADKKPPMLLNHLNVYVPKMENLFRCRDSEFLYTVDLANIMGTTGRKLLTLFDYRFPRVRDMMAKTHGIFLRNYVIDDGELLNIITYIPSTCKDEKAIPVTLKEEDFIRSVNNGDISKIYYKDGLPYIGTNPLFDVRRKN